VEFANGEWPGNGSSDHPLLVASGQNESALEAGALLKFNRPLPQAAILVGLTSRSLKDLTRDASVVKAL
jgi:hypothetical protein